MKAVPILTEKSLNRAKMGKYTFWVPVGLTKHQITKLISKSFAVDVKSVKTMNVKPTTKRNMFRKKIMLKAKKKAVVTLAEKQKIDVFGEGDKK